MGKVPRHGALRSRHGSGDYYERPRERALANELSARFWLERGQRKIAAVFMAEARSGYARWGAAAKVKHLERKYPDILDTETGARLRRPTEAVTPSLDISTVMKGAHAITVGACTGGFPA